MTALRAPLPASLRARLLVALVCIFALGGGAMLALVRLSAGGAHSAIEEKSLPTQARALMAGLRVDRSGGFVALKIPKDWRDAYREPAGAYFTLYDPAGRPVARSANLAAPLPFVAPLAGQTLSPLRIEGPQQDIALSAVGAHGFRLTVARSNPGRFDALKPDFIEDLAPSIVFALFALLGLAAAWTVALLSLRPLVRASAEAAAIGPERPSARLSEAGLPTEVLPLVRAMNAGLDRVAEAYAGEKRFTADAAHALRTPLAVLDLRIQRGETDGAVDWAAVRRDLAELARLVSGLLSLSKAERAEPKPRGPVNLARLVREAAASFEPKLEAGGRELVVLAPDDAALPAADAGALRDMICVLIDNALAHGRGRVTVEVEAPPGGDRIVRVSDEGLGVAEVEREAVFQRFHKLDANTPGAGLGLAIARHTARGHGGDAAFVKAASVEVRMR
jgi:two-component system sensor histidine kinase TctE